MPLIVMDSCQVWGVWCFIYTHPASHGRSTSVVESWDMATKINLKGSCDCRPRLDSFEAIGALDNAEVVSWPRGSCSMGAK
jgi:hypothetical protein